MFGAKVSTNKMFDILPASMMMIPSHGYPSIKLFLYDFIEMNLFKVISKKI